MEPKSGVDRVASRAVFRCVCLSIGIRQLGCALVLALNAPVGTGSDLPGLVAALVCRGPHDLPWVPCGACTTIRMFGFESRLNHEHVWLSPGCAKLPGNKHPNWTIPMSVCPGLFSHAFHTGLHLLRYSSSAFKFTWFFYQHDHSRKVSHSHYVVPVV